jgi:uncharacterized membrane protein YdjX (TVP38/TMEM64 family)
MGKQAEEEVTTGTGKENCSPEIKPRKSSKRAYIFGIIGVVLTLLMAAAILVFPDEVREMQKLGYLGAFIVSIPAGATVIIPVPAIAIVLALGGVMPFPWLVGLAAALGETVGALTIYMTGHGTSRAISESKHGRVQRVYDKLLELIERRGAITLFAVTSVVNPFFYPAAFACGALQFGLRKYLFIVLIGKIIKCMTVVYFGYFVINWLFRSFGINLY